MDIDSAAIHQIDYDPDRAKLSVRFATGCLYVYVGVPDEVHRSFVAADSKRRFFQSEIRDRYPFNRLESPPPACPGSPSPAGGARSA